jgi:dihydrofolate reductase
VLFRCSAFIATSVDGFIARDDGALDWLVPESSNPSEDYGYSSFMSSIDVVVLGRATFETVLSFGSWPYGDKRVVVLSRSAVTIPKRVGSKVNASSLSPRELSSQLAEEGLRHAYIDGGKTIQSFIEQNLINELTLTQIPVLIGTGIRLFGAVPKDVHLELVEVKQFSNGYVQSRYRIKMSNS